MKSRQNDTNVKRVNTRRTSLRIAHTIRSICWSIRWPICPSFVLWFHTRKSWHNKNSLCVQRACFFSSTHFVLIFLFYLLWLIHLTRTESGKTSLLHSWHRSTYLQIYPLASDDFYHFQSQHQRERKMSTVVMPSRLHCIRFTEKIL